MTAPAIVAQPPVITANSSDSVMPLRYGRTTSGASVWPTNTLDTADTDSA